ncbi:MAG: VacJ family lipoprotein [Syntrophobacteraceae bacterium]|nr:VacJ family lipoprotein [Syntrophobacteraceae bacterium]
MKKITRLAIAFFPLLIFSLLGFPILAGAQIFGNREQSVGSPTGEVEQHVWDPLERSNRKVFDFNDRLYSDVVEPITTVYRKLPLPVRNVVGNGFQNLEAPSRFVNFALQGKPHRASNEITRFVINSTLGVGGMFDVAQKAFGLQDHDADFGQTLGIWCVEPGPYLVVPALGPSNTRDLVGLAADSFMDPLYWVPGPSWMMYPVDFVKYTSKASDHIDQYETMKKASLDPYVAMRNAYMQHREDKIGNRPQQPEAIHASAEDDARRQAADRKAADEKALAQAREEELRKELKPRKNASPRELARALLAAAQNESPRMPFETVLHQYPQLAGAVAARCALAQDANFRPDWGSDNKQRLRIATEIICQDLARGDRFARGGNDSRLDRIREMACDQQRKLDDLERERESM